MGFTLSGFSATGGPCGCCDPPCTNNLTVLVVGECVGPVGGATLTYFKPDSSTITHVLAAGQTSDTITDPDAGTWTVTASRPCFDAPSAVPVTLADCKSQTLSLTIPLHFSTLHYSDAFGSVDISLAACGDTQAMTWAGTGYGTDPGNPLGCICGVAGTLSAQIGAQVVSAGNGTLVVNLTRATIWVGYTLFGQWVGTCQVVGGYPNCPGELRIQRTTVTIDCAAPVATPTFPAGGTPAVAATVTLS